MVNYVLPLVRRLSGVNSFVTRAVRKMMDSSQKQGKDVKLFVIGEKGRSQLHRQYAEVKFPISLTYWCLDVFQTKFRLISV